MSQCCQEKKRKNTMKNLLRKGLLLLCAFMLAAAMTACGSGNSDDTKDKTEAEETTPEEDTSDENADTSGDEDYDLPGLNENGKFNTLDDFINSSIMQDQLEEQVAALEESGISCEITAEGDKQGFGLPLPLTFQFRGSHHLLNSQLY